MASRILRFFAEWRRRKVSRAAVVYVVAGLATIEATNNILPYFGLDRFIPAVLTLVFVGFPVTLVLSWVFEISGGAIRRTAPLEGLKHAEGGSEPAPPVLPLPDEGTEDLPPQRVHERRRVSVVAARIEGYLSLSEALELEDFEGVRQRIREAAEKVASKYDGCVHGFSGEVVTLFLGLPRSHEDDAVRAVRAALEFRRWVQDVQAPGSPDPTAPSARQPPLDTRTAILAGPLVVEGCLDDGSSLEVSGDVHLLAAHLTESAGIGTLLVGAQVREQARGQFEFEELPPVIPKGRTEPIEISRLTASRQTPTTVHGRGEEAQPLVGRKPELQELQRGRERLAEGKGSVVAVAGAAGTGKSRLVSEFKQGIDPSETGWVEGHAFPFSREIPYSIIMDLLGRCWGIEDTDNAGALRAKIRRGIEPLGAGILPSEPYVGSLFALDYPELEEVQPEVWKDRLHSGVLQIFSALARAKPTIFFLEDLHWADGASLELIRYLTQEFRSPAILLCAYRQTDFEPFSDALKAGLGAGFREVELRELSSSEAHGMVEALLDSDTLPTSLTDFLAEKAEGNPFFIEEAVHSLVEKGDLVRSGGDWTLNRSLAEFEVPSTVHGLLLSRVDRLTHRVRKVLQEASVIGRVFPLRLLKRVSENPASLEKCLSTLEELGLIHSRKSGGDADYVFHHALAQEVVYGTLVRGDRRRIHRAVGVALEELFADRIAEFHETLAYHFKRGHANLKAVRYLSLAGEKSWRRYSLEESTRFFTEAYELLSEEEDRTQEENALLLSILNRWAIVFNHLGDYRTLARILRDNEELARSLSRSNPVEAALVFGWLGYGFQCQEELERSYRYLEEALTLARTARDPETIAYVSAWMARTCVDMGRLEEALAHGGRAEELAEELTSDAKLFRFTFSALGLAHYFRGDRAAVEGVAEKFLAFGERHTDLRSLLLGHVNEGTARIISGDFRGAIERLQKALGVSVDPMYSMYARLMLGVSYASEGMLSEAEETLNEVIQFDAENDFNLLGTTARGMFSIALLSKGDLAGGVGVAEEVIQSYEEKGNHYRHALQEYMLGTFYLRLVRKEGRGGVAFMAKNVGFLLRNLPHARDKAELHLSRSAEIASRIGAHGVLGQAFLALGQLHEADGQPEQASVALEKARAEFEWCGAEVYLEKVEEAESRVLLLS